MVLNCKNKTILLLDQKKKKKKRKKKPFCFIIGCKLRKNCPFFPCLASLVYSFYLQSTKHSTFWCVCMLACALPEQTTLQSTTMNHPCLGSPFSQPYLCCNNLRLCFKFICLYQTTICLIYFLAFRDSFTIYNK